MSEYHWVPWWYVHLQNDHATLRPTQNFYPTNGLQWRFTTVMLRPCNVFTIVTLWLCNVLLLWHFIPVMLYYCDISTLHGVSRNLTSTLLVRWISCHSVRTSSFFYLDCDMRSTFSLKQNVDVLSHVTKGTPGSLLAYLVGGGQNVTIVKL